MVQPDLGQYLLTDERVISRVIKAAELVPGDHVLDAGAGTGALTWPIAEAVMPGGRVWALEIDQEMVAALDEMAGTGVSVVAADLLEWPLPKTLTAVVANPPFKIAATIIERIAAAGVPRAVYVIPRELADRLVAKPGTEHYGKLTVRVGIHVTTEDLGQVSRKAFTPQPGVTCAIIRLRARKHVPVYSEEILARVLEAAREAWDRKARHAFGGLAQTLRCDGAALAKLLADEGWAEMKTSMLAPDDFAAVTRYLMEGQRKLERPDLE